MFNNVFNNVNNVFLNALPGDGDKKSTGKDPFYFSKSGYGFVENNAPIPELATILNKQYAGNYKQSVQVVNSESLAYGMLRAVQQNDREKFLELFKTVDLLSKKNYRETKTIKLLPWAVTIDRTAGGLNFENFKIVRQNPNDKNDRYGNSSAGDSDLDVMTAVIAGVQKGWGNKAMRSFVHAYAEDFIDQVVKVFPQNNGRQFYVFSEGSFIDGDGNSREVYYRFYPSYPNGRYIKYIADYFAKEEGLLKGGKNRKGSAYLSAQYNKLENDTKVLMDQFKKVYGGDLAKLPSRVMVSVGLDGSIKFKDPGVHDPADAVRLKWRTDDGNFNLFEKDLALKLQKNPNSYYYNYVQAIVSDENKQKLTDKYAVSDRFVIDDVLKNDTRFRNLLSVPEKHWWGFNGVLRDGYHIDNETQKWDTKAQDPGLDYSFNAANNEKEETLEANVLTGLDLCKSADTVDKGLRITEDALVRLAKKGELSNTVLEDNIVTDKMVRFVRWAGKNVLAPENRLNKWIQTKTSEYLAKKDYVGQYINNLRVMKGMSDKRIKERLNRILGAIEVSAQDNDKSNNRLVRRLYLEKALLWSALIPAEREQLKGLREDFSELKEVIQYQEELDKTYGDDLNKYIGFKVNVFGEQLDTANDSIEDIVAKDLPEVIKRQAINEIIKKTINKLIEDKKTAGEIDSYLQFLPSNYRDIAVNLLLYSKNVNYSSENKKTLIRKELEGLDALAGNKVEYNKNYVQLWKAYNLLLFQEMQKSIERKDQQAIAVNCQKADALFNAIPEIAQAMGYKIETKTAETIPDKGTMSKGDQKLNFGPLENIFAKKFDKTAWDNYKDTSSYEYGSMIAEVVGLTYWRGNTLSEENISNRYRDKAKDLLNAYKVANDKNMGIDFWENNHDVVAISLRLMLQEGGAVDNVPLLLKDIKEKQKEALEYKHYVAWENLIATELFLYGNYSTNYDRQEALSKWNNLKIDYIIKSLSNLTLR